MYCSAGLLKAADVVLSSLVIMKKNHFACLVLSACLSQPVVAQTMVDIPVVITIDSFELKGEVASVQERYFIYKNDEPQLAWDKETWFDNKGRIEITKVLNAGEKEQEVTRYAYSDAGKPLSEAIINGSKAYDSVSYEYNHEGELRRKMLFDRGKRAGASRYSYRNGKLNYIKLEEGTGALVNMVRFDYPGNNKYRRNVFDETLKYAYGELFTEEKDSLKARRWSCYFYPTTDSCSGQVRHIYDAAGRLTEDITTGPDKRVKQYITNTYNEHGLLDEQVVFTDAKRKLGYTYRFDDEGNWIERSKYADGKVQETTARKITYRKPDNKKAAPGSGIKVIEG